jgi:lipoyl(octanoyl) transferase
MPPTLTNLGRITYADALARQQNLVDLMIADQAEEQILLLEHDPVYTIGRTRDQSSLRDTRFLPHPVVETNRGGQATYHGPGQLVGYPLLDLNLRGRDLHKYLRTLEESLILLCQDFGVAASRREGLTGVWVGPKKIASIGVGVKKWFTMHGFAINILPASLEGFAHITPCGIAGVQMTSLAQESDRAVDWNEAVARCGAILLEQLATCLPRS